MIDDELISKMKSLHFKGMTEKATFLKATDDSSDFTDNELINLLFDAEIDFRKSKKTGSLIRLAGFSNLSAMIEHIDYSNNRTLNKDLINKLSKCGYILEKRNIIIAGAAGSGKTYLANALGIRACTYGIPTIYTRYSDFYYKMTNAFLTKMLDKEIKKFIKPRLLIIDEWLTLESDIYRSHYILDVLEARQNVGPTIFCTQIHKDNWAKVLGSSPLASSIVDRIVARAHFIEIIAKESMRSYINS
jgi:DNA replication protein DnaC